MGMLLSSFLRAAPPWPNQPRWSPTPERHPTGPIGFRTARLDPRIRHYVMGPLERVTNWSAFERGLGNLHSMGIQGITTDMPWGLVEPRRGEFDWKYELRYAEAVKRSGIYWLPIFSYHAIGGNVGDTTNAPLGDWVWQVASDMKFVSSKGYVSSEYIDYWTPQAYDLYESVMRSFAENFREYRDIIAKLYVSGGPAGEYRYPSFVPAAGWSYPGIGDLQAYSERAKASFRNFLKGRYLSLPDLSQAWGIRLESWESIQPPSDGEAFFRKEANGRYKTDFLFWYQLSIEEHMFQMLMRARRVFLPFDELSETEESYIKNWKTGFLPVFYGSQIRQSLYKPNFQEESAWEQSQYYWYLRSLLWRQANPPTGTSEAFLNSQASLGVKLAGIHWQRNNPELPRAAELAAGYFRYDDLLGLIRVLGASLTFTCMEMTDHSPGFPAYSTPRELVANVSNLAWVMDLPIYGENALSMNGDQRAFANVRKVLEQEEVHGFTVLRWGDLIDPEGNPTPNAEWYQKHVLNRDKITVRAELQLSADDAARAGVEVRVVGNDVSLGEGNPEKAPRLTWTGSNWRGEVLLNDPSRVIAQIIAFDPKSKRHLPLSSPSRDTRVQWDKTLVFYGDEFDCGRLISFPAFLTEGIPSSKSP